MIRRSTVRLVFWTSASVSITFVFFYLLFFLDPDNAFDGKLSYPIGLALLFGFLVFFFLKIGVTTEDCFIDRMTTHRNRILNSNHPERDFVSKQINDRVIAKLAINTEKIMRKTLKDREPRSMTITLDKVCFMIHTIKSSSAEKGQRIFQVKWGGYVKAMNEFMDSKDVTSSTAEVFCHITFGQFEGEAWINVSLVPLNSSRFKEVPIVAIDLIADSEI